MTIILFKVLLLILLGIFSVIGVRWISRMLLEFPEALVSHINWLIYRKWQGRYYAFDDKQVRFCVTATDVWLVEADILRLLHPRADDTELRAIAVNRGRIPRHGLKGIRVEGVRRLLRNRLNRRDPMREMVRLEWWLNNEAIPNVTRYPDSSM